MKSWPARRSTRTGVVVLGRQWVRANIATTAAASTRAARATATGASRAFTNSSDPSRVAVQKKSVTRVPRGGMATAEGRPTSSTHSVGASQARLVAGPCGPLLNDGSF